MASSRVDEKKIPQSGDFFWKIFNFWYRYFIDDLLLCQRTGLAIALKAVDVVGFCSCYESWSSNIWGQGMRKTGMMLVGLFGILVAGGADAVYKCANVYAGMKCEKPAATGDGWGATCGDTEIKGISVCGNDYDSDSDNVFVGAEPRAYCFCKMIKPAVTTWVLIEKSTINEAVKCSKNCDTACANAFVSDKDPLRSTMMNNIVM